MSRRRSITSDPFAAARLWTSSLRTLTRTAQAAAAMPFVIGTRAAMLHEAVSDPLQADHGENLRMVTEKVEAALLAGPAVATGALAWQREAWRALEEIWQDGARTATALTRARTPLEAMTVVSSAAGTAMQRAGAASLRAASDQARVARNVLSPYNTRISANARRLERVGRRRNAAG